MSYFLYLLARWLLETNIESDKLHKSGTHRLPFNLKLHPITEIIVHYEVFLDFDFFKICILGVMATYLF
jgi:hypothetical protein